MTAPQHTDQLRTGALALVGVGGVVLTLLLVWVAWLLVVPGPAPRLQPSRASTLEHELFEDADGHAELRAAGVRELDRCEWVDRSARVARIPIDRAIDAVVADPSLIAEEPPR